MTQEERWNIRYEEVKTFIETYHRNPSKYVDSERGLRNWVKQQKKLLNAGALEGQRLMMFNELLRLGEQYKRVNQYQWAREALVHGADALAAAPCAWGAGGSNGCKPFVPGAEEKRVPSNDETLFTENG